ncbi:MAG: MoaD/ThiS family protein [Firmicutes bacterium]|nr:MoaD/ThiS family protein [Bacillota bacterium]MCL5038337.1 MoaD/ThiS family protein [Bacillota bacterium]
MAVKVIVHGHSAEFFPEKKDTFFFEADGQTSIGKFLDDLGVKRELIMNVLVNGKRRGKEYVPQEGDEIILVSPLAGGCR